MTYFRHAASVRPSHPTVMFTAGPARVTDDGTAPLPEYQPRPVGFTATIPPTAPPPETDDVEPVLWEGDQA